jgi:glycosyltransferase involved in cell wall biosynthesis
MSHLKISVVTPSYNQGQFLEENFKSAFNQNYPILEYIVADGGSTDKSKEVIEKYHKYLTWWVSEKDDGQSHAINKGLKRASGEIVNWINSDDYIESGALKALEVAFIDPDVNVFIGRSNIVQNDKVIRQSGGTDVYLNNLAKTIGQARIDQPEHWWRKSVIDEIGPLNEALHFTMDRDWWVKYLLRHGLEGIKKEEVILANFRLHGDSKTVSQSAEFNQERNSYYRSLALHYGFNDHASQLEKLTRAGSVPMTDLPVNVDLDTLNASFSYFSLLLADEAYVMGNHASVRDLLQVIDAAVLSEVDQTFVDKLKFRSRLPASLIHFARKWRG